MFMELFFYRPFHKLRMVVFETKDIETSIDSKNVEKSLIFLIGFHLLD